MCVMLAPVAMAQVWNDDVHTTVVVSSYTDQYWSDINLKSGGKLTYKVSVTYGDYINVYLIDSDELTQGLAGDKVTQHTSDEDVKSMDRTYSLAGNYAVVITCIGSATAKVDITLSTPSFFDEWGFCIIASIIGAIVLIAIVVVVARRRAAPQAPRPAGPPAGPARQEFPQPGPQYTGYQGPPAPPAGYPQAQPSYQQQQQFPQPGYGAQPQPVTMVSCKYCGLQVPSNSSICSRCGGRL